MKWFNRTILILTPIMVLTSSIAFAASPVRRPVLYFNPLETRQNKGDNAWKNAGTAGGEIQKGEAKPILEMGPIEIPSIGLKADNAAWYTATRSKAVFANEVDDAKAPVVNLENFTIGLLMRVNGPFFAEENIVIGIQTEGVVPPRAREQVVRIWLDVAGKGIVQNVSIAQNVIQARHDFSNRKNKLKLGENEWHWVHIVFESGVSVTTYLDGTEAASHATEVKWDPAHDLKLHGIFTSNFEVQQRTCNCSIAIYRVYDRVLSADDVSKNVRNSLAVDPAGKLAVTWGKMKRGF
jgi:hypothetical protein